MQMEMGVEGRIHHTLRSANDKAISSVCALNSDGVFQAQNTCICSVKFATCNAVQRDNTAHVTQQWTETRRYASNGKC